MKIKRIGIALLLAGISFGAGSCAKEDIDDIRKELQEQDERLTSLEEWKESVETSISSLQTLIEALEDKDYVTGVTPLADESGYEITFLQSGTITIYHGEKGDTGATPAISVRQDTDGKYYWTLDGEWLLDGTSKIPVTGDKGDDGLTPSIGTNGNWWVGTTDTGIPAQGSTGDDGETPYIGTNGNWWVGTTDTGVQAQGEPGVSAIAPRVQINATTNEWEISTDGGQTWTSTGVKATGDKGDDGDSFFETVTVDEENGRVEIKLTDGQTFQLPLSKNKLTFTLNGTALTDLTQTINISQGDLTYAVAGDGTVSARILEGDGWTAEVVDSKIQITGKLGESALLELTLMDNGKVLEIYRLNLTRDFSGAGTQDDPYTISSAEELAYLARQVNGGTTYAGQYFLLTGDIDLSGTTMEPIGTVRNKAVAQGKAFQGTFDGDQHVIFNLALTTADEDLAQGLFGYNRGTIKNLILENASVKGTTSQGTLVGDNRGTVENCHVRGSITVEGCSNIGGLVGYNYGDKTPATVTNCSVTGALITGTKATVGIGGVIGYNTTGRVTACRFHGKLSVSPVSSATSYSMGGIVGNNSGLLSNDESLVTACYANCEVEQVSNSIYSYMGGVAGTNAECNYGRINKLTACYAVVAASSTCTVGGVCGQTGEDITACFWQKSGDGTYPQYGIYNINDVDKNPDKISNENAEPVAGSWDDAMAAMNAALAGTGWRYAVNTGTDSDIFPLIIEAE